LAIRRNQVVERLDASLKRLSVVVVLQRGEGDLVHRRRLSCTAVQCYAGAIVTTKDIVEAIASL